MTPRAAGRWFAAVAATALCACGTPSASTTAAERLGHLATAVRLAPQDPAAAAREAAAAGAGPVLEAFRFELWCDALSAADAPAEDWRQLLAARPPVEQLRRAWLALAETLADDGDHVGLRALLAAPPPGLEEAADELSLRTGDGPDPAAAARRLAVAAPARLRRTAPDLERALVASLATEERLQRAEAWRRDGAPATARAELHGFTATGEAEARRRRLLARAELEAGSTSGALAALPPTRLAAPADEAERARAWRSRGWSRYPGGGARSAFASCAAAAGRAAAGAPSGSAVWLDAQQSALECATEAGRLDDALAAWNALAAAGWHDDRRDWLGRRLGVALALQGRRQAESLARSLPDDARCIRFWLAVDRDDDQSMGRLAAAAVPDLYGGWARQRLALPPAAPAGLAPAVGAAPPPFAIRWLLDHDREGAALGEWRRLAARRGLTRPEALAAAEQAVALGDRFGAIRLLRVAMPDLGGSELDREPADAVRAYLPLPYAEAVRAAAVEQGLAPWLVAAVARQESAFHPRARSPRNARGLMQLLPATASGHARSLGIALPPDLDDPAVNLRLGARELAQLVDRFGAVEPALAAYNAGPARVARWWARTPERRRFVEEIPIPETYTYVRRVTFLAEAYRQVYSDRWQEAP